MKTAISEEVIRIREMQGAEILDSVSCAYISERFFKRSRAWFTQRLNNNTVNGKPVSFNPNELLTLRTALKVIASELTQLTTHIPNIPTDMSIKVYVMSEPALIEFIISSDLDGFTSYLQESKESDDFLSIPEPAYFDTEAEALAYCAGIGQGLDDRAIPTRLSLRSSEPTDLPFIEALESY